MVLTKAKIKKTRTSHRKSQIWSNIVFGIRTQLKSTLTYFLIHDVKKYIESTE